MSYTLTLEADNDLISHWFYGLEKWGLQQADAYKNQLENMMEFLSKQPNIGRNREDIEPRLKSYVSGSHTIFYLIREDDICVVRVLHQSVDVSRHFHS